MLSRRDVLGLAAGAVAFGASGCAPGAAPSSPPSMTTASPVDTALPGEARRLVDALCAAARSRLLVKVELQRSEASIAAVVGERSERVETWAWRDGRAQLVDGDTRDVGQARFDPADFDLDDVRGLLTLAGVVAGSASGQVLQIVEYSGARVLMTVTTQPESRPIFFRPDGSLIRPLNYAYPPDIADGLAEATAGLPRVTALGLLPAVGVWADRAGRDAVLRQVRAGPVPTRSETRSELSPLVGRDFDAAAVDPQLLVRLARERGRGRVVTFVADRRDGLPDPLVRLTVDGRTSVWTVGGEDVTERYR